MGNIWDINRKYGDLWEISSGKRLDVYLIELLIHTQGSPAMWLGCTWIMARSNPLQRYLSQMQQWAQLQTNWLSLFSWPLSALRLSLSFLLRSLLRDRDSCLRLLLRRLRSYRSQTKAHRYCTCVQIWDATSKLFHHVMHLNFNMALAISNHQSEWSTVNSASLTG